MLLLSCCIQFFFYKLLTTTPLAHSDNTVTSCACCVVMTSRAHTCSRFSFNLLFAADEAMSCTFRKSLIWWRIGSDLDVKDISEVM